MRHDRLPASITFLLAFTIFIGPGPANGQASLSNPPIKENCVVFLTLSQEDYGKYLAMNPSSEQALLEFLSDFEFYGHQLIDVLRTRGIAASFKVGKELSFELNDGTITRKALKQEDIIGLALFAKGKTPVLVRRPRLDEAETKTIRVFGDYDSMAKVISEYFEIWLPPYKGQDIAWARIREAFKRYSAIPSSENAERILASLPNNFDNNNVNQEEWERTLNYLDMIDGTPFRVLESRIRQGDESAIRVAFRTNIITDGAVTEDLFAIISEAIRSNPLVFLEELAALRASDEHGVNFILRQDSDIDTYTLAEDPPSREAFKKEIILRMKVLKTVAQPNLVEIRDYCLKKYEGMLDELK